MSKAAVDSQMDDGLKARIDAMTQEEMARAWRFAPAGDPRFQGDVGRYFDKRFQALGGMTPQISKRIGLGR